MNFVEYKYKDIGKIRSGKRLKKGYAVSNTKSNNRYIRVRDIYNGMINEKDVQYITDEAASFIKKYRVYTNDLIISVVGTVGAIATIPEALNGAYLTENCDNLLVDEKICLKEYLKYYLMSSEGQNEINSHIVGTTQPKLPIYGIEAFNIKVPSIEIQSKIIKLLNILNKKILLNTYTNNNLLEIGDAIYIANINRYNNSKLPKDWKTKTLKEVTNNFDFKRKPMSSRERIEHKGKYPYYGATSIIDYVDDFIFDNTYILMGEDGTVITSDNKPVLQYVWGKIWVNNHAHVLQGKNISEEYLYFCLRNTDVKALITGAVQPKINQENMNKLRVIIPDRRTLTEVENKLSTIMKKYKENSNEINILIKIRDALLPKLMNGEIDLDKIEI